MQWVMLAKAKCDEIVRRAASTIPVEFLPHILLCSGLSRSSVVTIIQKLGQVVGSAHDKHEMLQKLLAPRTVSGLNAGQTGNKLNAINKKLLGSISAYFRFYMISFPTANPFLSSLTEDIAFSDSGNTTKETHKKIKGTDSEIVGSTHSATSFLSVLGNLEISSGSE
jgi:hypothetical protein